MAPLPPARVPHFEQVERWIGEQFRDNNIEKLREQWKEISPKLHYPDKPAVFKLNIFAPPEKTFADFSLRLADTDSRKAAADFSAAPFTYFKDVAEVFEESGNIKPELVGDSRNTALIPKLEAFRKDFYQIKTSLDVFKAQLDIKTSEAANKTAHPLSASSHTRLINHASLRKVKNPSLNITLEQGKNYSLDAVDCTFDGIRFDPAGKAAREKKVEEIKLKLLLSAANPELLLKVKDDLSALTKSGIINNTTLNKITCKEIDFSGFTIDNLRLENSQLTSANFKNCAFFGGSSFEKSSIASADFSGCTRVINLGGDNLALNFKKTILRQSNFTDASLHADFTGADLSGANFTNTSLWGDLTEAKLQGIKISKSTIFNDCPGLTCAALREMAQANLTGKDIEQWVKKNCTLNNLEYDPPLSAKAITPSIDALGALLPPKTPGKPTVFSPNPTAGRGQGT